MNTNIRIRRVIIMTLLPILLVGMAGFVPGLSVQADNEEQSENNYVVVSGDTMWDIAIRHGVTLTALINANPHIENPDLIFPGQELTIPDPVELPLPPDDIIPITGPGESLYVVRPGDAMWRIAMEHDLTLSELNQLNPHIVNPNLIFPGQRIVITEEDPVEPDPTPAPPDEVIFQDNFSTRGLWFTAEDTHFWIRYRDHGYQIYNDFFNAYVNSVRSFNFADIHVEVNAQRVSGSESGYYGVVCRWQDVDNFYALAIGSEGFLTIARVQNGFVNFLAQREAEEELMNFGAGEFNRIGGSCVEDTLTLFVNDEPVLEAQDHTFTSGFVGLMTGTRTASGLLVHFEDFSLLNP
jgi:spore coat assembly protein SafA